MLGGLINLSLNADRGASLPQTVGRLHPWSLLMSDRSLKLTHSVRCILYVLRVNLCSFQTATKDGGARALAQGCATPEWKGTKLKRTRKSGTEIVSL